MPTQSFNTQSGWAKFNVPKGVDRVIVDLKGAGSGANRGGRVQGQIKVKDDDVLYVLVGGQGKAPDNRQGGAGGPGGGGGGGDASAGKDGGRGGGGASAIRMNSNDGTIKAVAGGAGGHSGDNGDGGEGGASTGQHGWLGNAGTGNVGNAVGGSQSQAGKGGTSSAGGGFDGSDGESGGLGKGGHGGQQTNASSGSHGGGGGGGGYRAGGGGAASAIGQTPGGGGGGGSNFTGGLFTGVSSVQGGGGTGDGSVTITWNSPPPANQPPTTPGSVKVDGKNESSNMSTRSTGKVRISAEVRDPDAHTVDPVHTGDPSTQSHQKARLVVHFSASKKFTHVSTVRSSYVDYGKRAEVVLHGLDSNTLYYARLLSEDIHGKQSINYNGISFWTNRHPDEPNLVAPSDNIVVQDTDAVTFDWSFKDPDDGDSQTAFTLRWRRAAQGTANDKPSDWTVVEKKTRDTAWVISAGTFRSGAYYEWEVRTRDEQGAWGRFALPRAFYCQGSSSTPRLTYPIRGQSVDVSDDVTFKWKFRDPADQATQDYADLRWRVKDTTDWITYTATGSVPGSAGEWTLAADHFMPGFAYEWEVRTNASTTTQYSDWSEPETFHVFAGLAPAVTDSSLLTEFAGSLGCGTHRVFVYDRGGKILRGEITPLTSVQWTRNRDEMGNCLIVTNGFGSDCGSLLKATHTWMNELVVYRDGERVFEGPITLIEDSRDGFKIEAKDVLGYVYRRILRQGFNDSYHVVNGVVEGLPSVVERATQIIADALVRDDPNVLRHLTPLNYPDDARESRVVPDYSVSAYEEIDDMAANSGLDYSVIGRRIILNDTHRAVGRLPEFRPEYFNDPPKITEYGMQLADYYASTNNAGLWGAVEHKDSPYGGVEILVSSFSEVGAAAGEKLSRAKQQAVRQVLIEQAKRGIASRYPAPYVVRVPDNNRLVPETPVGINQLVPGVWIPLRASGTVIEISQWQKLDQVQVSEAAGDEEVRVTMSPAPNRGQDPDAEGADVAQETP